MTSQLDSQPSLTPAIYAKQPIFDQQMAVMGFELLFRPSDKIGLIDDQAATAQVILNAMTSDDQVLADPRYKFFINHSTECLLQPLPLDASTAIVEILETVTVTPAVIAAVQNLKMQGYQIALDDFDMTLSTAKLLPWADIIKIDFQALDEDKIALLVGELAQYSVKLLAEKIETQGHFQLAESLGFDYYQGYFFCRPQLTHQRLARPSKISTLQLLRALMDPEVRLETLSAILKNDPVLTVKLLRLANLGIHVRITPIRNIEQALVVFGLDKLRQWVSLIALTDLDDKPHELLRQTLLRAIALERFGQFLGSFPAGECFFIGFLSVIDAFLDRPLDEVLANLPLDTNTRAALIERAGPAGELLTLLQYMIEGRWDHLTAFQDSYPLHDFFRLFLVSETEAEQLLALLN